MTPRDAGLTDFVRLLAGPGGWQGRERFVVFTPDFQDGASFLATWAAWRADPARCTRLHFVAIAPQAPSREALALRLAPSSPETRQLQQAWPPLTPNLHTLTFAEGKVQLLLAPGMLRDWLPELVLQIDAFWLPFPDGDESGCSQVCKAFARLSTPGAGMFGPARAGDPDAWRSAQAHLRSVGFQHEPIAADAALALHARYAPSFTPRRPAWKTAVAMPSRRHALIVGAGLAGSAVAGALAEQGWHSTVIDRHHRPAQETSGNPGGLFHGIVNAQDGPHARFNRAAALLARRAVEKALRRPGAQGGLQGLLRLETTLPDVAAMGALLRRLNLPDDYVQALSPAEASARCNVALAHPAWFYPGGGWVRPADLVASCLASAPGLVTFRGGMHAQRLRHVAHGWQLLDSHGEVIEESEVVVLANAGDALRLLGHPEWPVHKVRGQVSVVRASALPQPLPWVPLAGSGYLLPAMEGGLALFGATTQPHDDDPRVRDSDHAHNLAQLSRLTGWERQALPRPIGGRTAWRCVADDRLPVAGAVPDLGAGASPAWDQPRKVPRMQGLYVVTALGSRGITWSAVLAQVVACAIAGAPMPLESSLQQAIDPARFVSRNARRSARPR